jgi:hypothetical protein
MTVGASGGPGASTVTISTWQIVGNNRANRGNNYNNGGLGSAGHEVDTVVVHQERLDDPMAVKEDVERPHAYF